MVPQSAEALGLNAAQLRDYFDASIDGDSYGVRKLLSNPNVNIPIDVATSEGWTSLLFASRHGHTDVVKVLLEAKCNVNTANTVADNDTALMHACAYGHLETVRALLDAGADALLKTKKRGSNALMQAIWNGFAQVVEMLLQYGVPVDTVNNAALTPLMCCVMSPHGHATFSLILQYGFKQAQLKAEKQQAKVASKDWLNAQSADGWTALMHACQQGHEDQVQQLLEAGADVNIVNARRWTALMLAVRNQHEDVVNMLIEYGADLDIQSTTGTSALMHAAWTSNTEIARALVVAGAKVNLHDSSGLTAFDMAQSDDVRDEIVAVAKHKRQELVSKEQVTAIRWRDACEDVLYVKRLHLSMQEISDYVRSALTDWNSHVMGGQQNAGTTAAVVYGTNSPQVAQARSKVEAVYMQYKEQQALEVTNNQSEKISGQSKLNFTNSNQELLNVLNHHIVQLKTNKLNSTYEAAANLIKILSQCGLQYLLPGVQALPGEFALLDPDPSSLELYLDPFAPASVASASIPSQTSPVSLPPSPTPTTPSSNLPPSVPLAISDIDEASVAYVTMRDLLVKDEIRLAAVIESLQSNTFAAFETARDRTADHDSKRSFFSSPELGQERLRVLAEIAPWLEKSRLLLRNGLNSLKLWIKYLAARIGTARQMYEEDMSQLATMIDQYRRLQDSIESKVEK